MKWIKRFLFFAFEKKVLLSIYSRYKHKLLNIIDIYIKKTTPKFQFKKKDHFFMQIFLINYPLLFYQTN